MLLITFLTPTFARLRYTSARHQQGLLHDGRANALPAPFRAMVRFVSTLQGSRS